MTYQLIIRPEAEADITNAAVWYENQQSGLGHQFLAEVHDALDRVTANPHQYRRLRRKPDVRRVLTRRFAYRIFFVLRPDIVVVFRVLHSARHDREWKRTIPEN